MKKQHLILAGSGLIVLLLLFYFGQTVPPKKATTAQANADSSSHRHITTPDIIQASKQNLTSGQAAYVNGLETAVVRGDVKAQQIKVYNQLAAFWRDSINSFLPAAFYTGEVAKLENIEKNLTFAAHLYLDKIRFQAEPELKSWMAEQAKGLLEQALKLNPTNDSLKVSLGSCYMYDNHGTPMEGIKMILEVADRDPHNVYAQMMLGIGGTMTGQFDKAIERFRNVLQHQPANLEARLNLAEIYERKGDKKSAIEWYEKTRALIKNEEIVREIDMRIALLKK